MSISVTLPEINIEEKDLKLLLAIKLLDDGLHILSVVTLDSYGTASRVSMSIRP
jgi:hypothetical protein